MNRLVILLLFARFAADSGPVVQADDTRFLETTARELLEGCRVKADDGTVLFTPDGKGNYRALWTRDFAYMVENAGDLMPAKQVEAVIEYLLRGQREDGAMPDRVRPDGVAVYVAGPESNPLGEPNLDNPQFMVIAANAFLARIDPGERKRLWQEWLPRLDRGMEYLPRSPRGLVFNDPARVHSPYGFTDTVGKTGELFMESLLYWQAARILERAHQASGDDARAAECAGRAKAVERGVDVLWNAEAGMFDAASLDCRQLDIWGNAYALYIRFPLADKRERMLDFLVRNYDRYVWRGQIRHLLEGEHWERLLTPVPPGRYQNGAYWATASGWVMSALAERAPDLARRTFRDLIEDFRAESVCECINRDYRQLPSYVVSATNPLPAARRLFGTLSP